MAKRTRVNCEKCNSFLHETKDCDAEKVLGFKKPSGRKVAGDFTCVFFDKRNKYKIDNSSNHILLLPRVYKDQFTWEQVPVVSVEWLEKWCKDFYGTYDVNGNYHNDCENIIIKFFYKDLLKAVRLQAKTPTRQAKTSTTASQSCKPAIAGRKRVTFKNRYGEDIHFLVRTKSKEAKK